MTDNPIINTTTDEYRIGQLNDRIATLNKEVDELVKDIQVIGEALIAEAKERGWCADYDDFVDGVNNDLKRGSLPTRVVDFTASVSISVSFQSSPDESSDKIADIMRAIHGHGDNLGSELYTIGDWTVDHLEAD
jgi:hypothetical protein